ncbi:MAG: hypothetical protein KGL39_49055 [Patescibacteria group bacterium]|nr:hypothetical protein [Patescibacteria group bacterium]
MSIEHGTCDDCLGDLEIRRRRLRGGSFQFRRQCVLCGRAAGSAVKAAIALAKGPIPDFDEILLAATEREEQDRWDLSKKEHEEKKSQWWADYNAYLQTPEWKARRDLVLARAKGICEGCLKNKATQVHHLTYAHVGDELLFELVAICDICHDIAHSGDDE